MKFKVPCRWDVRTNEEIEATDAFDAEMKAGQLLAPKTLEGCEIVPCIGVVDYEEMNRLYPPPIAKDPMDGWECIDKPDGYQGGRWRIRKNGCTIDVFGIMGEIEVGPSFTMYGWEIESGLKIGTVISRKKYSSIESARRAALKICRFLHKLQK